MAQTNKFRRIVRMKRTLIVLVSVLLIAVSLVGRGGSANTSGRFSTLIIWV